MKIWKVFYFNKDSGTQMSWHSSKADAIKSLDRAITEYDGETYPNSEPSGLELVNVPTTKAALIAWLNDNLNTDNG